MKLQDILEQDNRSKIKWAHGRDIDKATNTSQFYQGGGIHDDDEDDDVEDRRMGLIMVNIEKLMSQTNASQRLDLNALADPNSQVTKGRLIGAKKHWDKGGYMDPSEISWSEWDDSFGFRNGRHRLVAAYQRGESFAPVVMPIKQFKLAKEKLDGKPI